MAEPFIAIDWGMTNRTVFDFGANGELANCHRDSRGVLTFERSELPAEIARLRSQYGKKAILAAGSIGSDMGWVKAPYVKAPATIAQIASMVVDTDIPFLSVVPGVEMRGDDGMPDVMRGEELQFLGADAAGLVPPGALLCQPGTHCKWARVDAARLTWFSTAMTGELFALLSRHSLLIGPKAGPVDCNGPEFARGVLAAPAGALQSLLFKARAARVTGKWSSSQSAAYVSGLLIGSDVFHHIKVDAESVYVLADREIGNCYITANRLLGGSAKLVDSEAAFAAGARQVWRAMAGELA
ncbi:MAG: 2-dehydro-3-deoxygalactonokinase [Erythrobacter sp.]